MSEKQLLLRKRQRGALKTNVGKVIQSGHTIDQPTSPESAENIQNVLGKLTDYRARITLLNDQILLEVVEDDEADTEAQNAADFDEDILEMITALSTKLATFEKAKIKLPPATASAVAELNVSHQSNGDHRPSVQLPKLQISKYGGDPLKWQEFWDSYSTSIHDVHDLAPVDKFKYLRSFLVGDAFRLVEGYRLTSDNYEAVVEALTERFGNKQIAINAHIEALLAIPGASHETSQLQKTYDDCERHIRSLMALGLAEETFGQVFTPIILSKLPVYVKMELHRKIGTEAWTLAHLRELLKEEIRARDMSQRSFGVPNSTEKASNPGRTNRYPQQRQKPSAGSSSSLLTNVAPRGLRCSFCSEAHYTDQCRKYPDIQSRRQRVKGRCQICLSTKHMGPQCPARQNQCFHCHKIGHHRGLCPTKLSAYVCDRGSRGAADSSQSNASVGDVNPVNSALLSHGEQAILQTALAQIRGVDGGNLSTARLMFDTGSSRTFITTAMAHQIGARPEGKDIISIAGFGADKRTTVTYNRVAFDIVIADGMTTTITANVTPTISCPVQKWPVDVGKYPVMRHMVMAEPTITNPQMVVIDVLIGTDYYYDFIGSEQIKCPDGVVFLSSSFGFVATGRVQARRDTVINVSTLHLTGTTELTSGVERYWSLEDIGVKPPLTTNDDEEALQSFNDSVRFEEGRYSVTFPIKVDAPELPDNRKLAYVRLQSLLKKLASDSKLFESYNDIIQDQLSKGIIELAPHEPTGDAIHYIPHHCVVTPQKSTTKVRIVYDASAKATKSSPSLNECMHRGPVLLDDLCGLLMRFRLHPIGIVSDIEKAFLQVGLQPCSRDLTRFMWVKNPCQPLSGDNLIILRFTRVMFGAVASPFLLGAVIHHHVKESTLPVASDVVGNIYVDNIIVGKGTIDEASNFYTEAKALFNQASMNLREWYTNSRPLLDAIEPNDRGKDTVTKVLGLTWDTKADTLTCSSFKTTPDAINTKRQMLKHLAMVFDPCGFFSAVTVTGKLLIQKLWQQKYGWDDTLPPDLVSEWMQCSSELQQIPDHNLPRCINQRRLNVDVQYQLHCFCDASAKAYSAVVYLMASSSQGIQVDLIFAKSRVAPVKVMSIPRLELMAALIGTRLLVFVCRQLRINITNKTVWSDSQCVLHWLVKKSISTVFVKNRVAEITSHPDIVFRYVPTGINPADLPSRGCTTTALVNNQLWWKGPPFLAQKVSSWPKDIEKTDHPSEDEVNIPTNDLPVDSLLFQAEREPLLNVADFSRLSKLLRVTSWITRFINNARHPAARRAGRLSVDELRGARLYWEKYVQETCFSELMVPNPPKGSTSKVANLNLFLDNNAVLRCGGRYQHADIDDDAKFPKLLPKNNCFTDLVIRQCHEQLLHSGVAHTLSQLRLQYWVIHGRVQVKRMINGCLVCRAAHGSPFHAPPYPPLPDFRVTQQKPFTRVGIDYLGPLIIRTKTGTQKIWVCLFTCAVIRAIHLEVVDQLSTEQFLMCLRRFISIRGAPELIISDNAKQFHTADTTLHKLWCDVENHDIIRDFSVSRGITWKFITELSPWMGGFYERMIGVVKRALKKALDRRCVTMMELQTVIAEITTVVNSRPLLYSEASPSGSTLTPSHFIGGPLSALPRFSATERDYQVKQTTTDDLIRHWSRIRSMLDSFWSSWRNEYMLSLRTTPSAFKQRHTNNSPPTIGSVVLVKDNLPRNQWKLGVITLLRESADGMIRTASLRLSNRKTITRPIKLLYPLEITDNTAVNDPENNVETARGPPTKPRRRAAVVAAAKIKRTDERSSVSDDSDSTQ